MRRVEVTLSPGSDRENRTKGNEEDGKEGDHQLEVLRNLVAGEEGQGGRCPE